MVNISIEITYETYNALKKIAKNENKRIAQEILSHETNTRIDKPVFRSYKEMQENK